MTTEADRAEFWAIVQACLVDIFKISPARADQEIVRLNKPSARLSSGQRQKSDLIYHSQPIHVASNIAIDDEPMPAGAWERYDEILRRFHPSKWQSKIVETSRAINVREDVREKSALVSR